MNMRTRWIAVVAVIATFLIAALAILPRISEAVAGTGTTPTPNAVVQDQKGDITVVPSYQNDTSKPLREMKGKPAYMKAQHANENPKVPTRHRDGADPVVQN